METITGCNTNVEYKGHTYHVQTEDSGTSRPHVITHVFADGGRVIATRRTDYAELRGDPDWTDVMRFLIKAHHKAMLDALTNGRYDDLIAVRAASADAEPRGEPPLDLSAVRRAFERARARAAKSQSDASGQAPAAAPRAVVASESPPSPDRAAADGMPRRTRTSWIDVELLSSDDDLDEAILKHVIEAVAPEE